LARLTRHQLKQDELSARLATWTDYSLKHRKQISLGLAIGLGVLAVGIGAYYFIRGAQNNAAAAFAKALNTYHAPVMVSPPNVPNLEVYKTNDEKNQKALDAFNQVAKDYSHYAAGRLARYYAAVCLRDLGKFPEAEKEFQALSQGGDAQLASLAKVGLASVYEQTKRDAEAEKVYKDLEAHPTETVPKASALVARADLYRKTNPAEATTLYQQIQKDYVGSPAAEYAGQELTRLPH
jgi:tetratricopeptide (TPR) repeat protein